MRDIRTHDIFGVGVFIKLEEDAESAITKPVRLRVVKEERRAMSD